MPLFNGEGDCLGAKQRPSDVHSADDWSEMLLPAIERQQTLGKEVVFSCRRGLRQAGDIRGAGRTGCNVCHSQSGRRQSGAGHAELLTRPVGRQSHKPVVWYKRFLYQAASWKIARRVVAKVEFHFGELFPRVGFIVTNLETPNRSLV